ncbi:FeoA family protein [Lachnoclostridium sp. Marseille-P6806]|uniref:FeoA family protein n=1 Tax=Lachnoclostridium sp. Marseille-P6806 TaxID=2364793 RepID=UPI0010314A40|nr:ferrous iron transport protein A [Lachnoclostridium sp. Marseille-P6806]
MVALSKVRDGEEGVIMDVSGDKRYLSRIMSVGLNIGCRVKMLQNIKCRPLLVYGRDTMIALNREEAEHIKVEVRA